MEAPHPGIADAGRQPRGRSDELRKARVLVAQRPLGPRHDLQPAAGLFDDCREALDPVAVVGVEHAFDGVHLGGVDVAAEHAVGAAPLGFARHRVL